MAKSGSSSRQSSTATVSTGVTDGGSEYQCCTLPSSIDSSRAVKSSTKRKYNYACLSLRGLRKQVTKWPLMPYASGATKCYQTVLYNLSNFADIVTLITLNIRTEILSFLKRHVEALTNCQSLMV